MFGARCILGAPPDSMYLLLCWIIAPKYPPMHVVKFSNPVEGVKEGERLRELCETITRRRDAYSYLDVCRAYVLLTYLEHENDPRKGVIEAFAVGVQLRIGRTTVDNWFKRDLPRWVERMRWTVEGREERGHKLGTRARYTMTPARLDWIARIRMEHKWEKSWRRIAKFVREKATRPIEKEPVSPPTLTATGEPAMRPLIATNSEQPGRKARELSEMGELATISHATLWRHRHKIEKRAAELRAQDERNLAAAKRARTLASEQGASRPPIDENGGETDENYPF